MNDAQHSGVSPQSVAAVAQRNYKRMHLRGITTTQELPSASVMHLWDGRSTPPIRRHRPEAGHAVINVSIYLEAIPTASLSVLIPLRVIICQFEELSWPADT